MSSAHRPTWDPAQGRADDRHVSQRFSSRQMPAHTKLKFRAPQQGGQQDINLLNRDALARRDLKAELEAAERDSRNQKRKTMGLAPEEESLSREESELKGKGEESKRRKLIQEAAMAKEDDDDDDDDEDEGDTKKPTRGTNTSREAASSGSESDSSSSDDDDDDDDGGEDETAALLRELEKIKRERAEEKARQEKEKAELEQTSREEEIALGNPLLNLENAMKGSGHKVGGSNKPDFGVKRRWDDDVIFKNQAAGNDGGDKSGFVNDLTRSEFHRRFLHRYIR